MSGFCATSSSIEDIETDALNSQQSFAHFSYSKPNSHSHSFMIQSLKTPSCLEIRTNEELGYPCGLAVYKDRAVHPIVDAAIGAAPVEKSHMLDTAVVVRYGQTYIQGTFKTRKKDLKTVDPPTVGLDEGVAIFQYNLPMGASGNFHSLRVTVNLANLSTFIFSGRKSATKNTRDPFFMLGYCPNTETLKALKVNPIKDSSNRSEKNSPKRHAPPLHTT